MSDISEGVTFTVSLDSAQRSKLEVLLMRSGLKDYSQLMDEALTLLGWAVEQVESGREIASYSRIDHIIHVETTCLPSLVHITTLRKSLENDSD